MPKVQVEVEGSGLDLMKKVAGVVSAAKAGGASAALASAVSDLVAVVADVQAVPADVKEDEAEFIKGCLCGVVDVAKAALSK